MAIEDWNYYTIGFYNLENLFDTQDDPNTVDESFTPNSSKKWDEKKLQKKLQNLGGVIAEIGPKNTETPPVLIGVAEVENRTVLERLIATPKLKKYKYDIIHFSSKDERGIDNALLYRPEHFNILETNAHPFFFLEDDGSKDFTRDIIEVKGRLQDQEVTVLINHWPSRRTGVSETEPKRIMVANKNKAISTSIKSKNPDAKIIIMGDFNDNPNNKSVQLLENDGYYNPMDLIRTKVAGSLTHKGEWNLFDQILISENFLQGYGNPFRFEKAAIFNTKDVQVTNGRYKGHPFRTYVGPKYLGGISDHFPVYAIFKILK